MAYERINWQNEPSEATAVNDVNLNKMDSAIYELDGKATTTETAITALQDGKVDKESGKGLSYYDVISVARETSKGSQIGSINLIYKNGNYESNPLYNGIEVDSSLDGTSENPVENKAIYNALNNLLPSKTVSGNPISISDASGFNAKALTVSMNPIQDLHGYDSPWFGGAGKNKCPINESTITGATYIVDTDINIVSGTWTFSFESAATTNCSLQITDADGNTLASVGISYPSRSATVTINTVGKHLKFYGYAGTYKNIQIEQGTATTFAPYSNICPISGRTEASITRTAGEDVETHTHQYGQTVYGGEDDFVSGSCKSEVAKYTLGNITAFEAYQGNYYATYRNAPNIKNVPNYTNDIICDRLSYVGALGDYYSIYHSAQVVVVTVPRNCTVEEYNSKISGADIIYPLAAPTTISTSAEEITLLKGNNVLSTNADDIELKYSVSLDSLLTT